jgi:hypothetical protein
MLPPAGNAPDGRGNDDALMGNTPPVPGNIHSGFVKLGGAPRICVRFTLPPPPPPEHPLVQTTLNDAPAACDTKKGLAEIPKGLPPLSTGDAIGTHTTLVHALALKNVIVLPPASLPVQFANAGESDNKKSNGKRSFRMMILKGLR